MFMGTFAEETIIVRCWFRLKLPDPVARHYHPQRSLVFMIALASAAGPSAVSHQPSAISDYADCGVEGRWPMAEDRWPMAVG
jgi:hypothetical protein